MSAEEILFDVNGEKRDNLVYIIFLGCQKK